MNILEARRRTLGGHILKKTAQGNPAIATDSLARMYPGIVMNGWTTQDGTPTPEAPVPIVSAGTQNQDTGKWEYEIEVGCGNLFNKSTANENKYINNDNGIEFDGSGTYASDYINVFGFDNIRCTNTGSNQWMAFYNHENIFISGVNGYGEALPVPQNAMYARFTITNGFINTFSVNAGITLLPYTPYRPPQTVTLTADRPLTKWDKLEKRNGQWGWVYKSMEITLDGSEEWLVYTAHEGFYIGYVFDTPRLRAEGFCESFICEQYNNGKDAALWLGVNNYSVYAIRIPQYNEEFPDFGLQDWKDWLSENPTTILTYADEETFVPLSASEQEQMNNLYTYRPTTVLSNQQGCQMALTYKTRKGVEGGGW